jgi:hypothetical protein
VIQRVMCRVPHSKDVVAYVGALASEIFDQVPATASEEQTPVS